RTQTYPFIDVRAGGSVRGEIAALNENLRTRPPQCPLAKNAGFNENELRRIRRLVIRYESALIEAWNDFFDSRSRTVSREGYDSWRQTHCRSCRRTNSYCACRMVCTPRGWFAEGV